MKIPGYVLGILALWLPGCDDDDGAEQADAVVGADAGADAEPPFNYIPLNDNACELDQAAPALATSADQTLTRLLTNQNTLVAQGLEVCGVMTSNGCPACAAADNPMARLLADLDGSLGDYIASVAEDVDLSDGLMDYFQRALRYPYRYLTVTISQCGTPGVSCPAGKASRVALTQGKKQKCVGNPPGCNHYTVEPESLAATCNAVPMSMYGPAPVNAGGKKNYDTRLFDAAVADVTFGFLVPLVEELPPNAETLSDAALEAWIAELEALENSLEVRVTNPQVKLAMNGDGRAGCGTITGLVHKSTFTSLLADEDSVITRLFNDTILPRYVEPDNPDYIKGVLSFRLESGTFASGVPCGAGSCSADTSMCSGTVLNASYSNDTCTQPRPANYTTGARINASCTAAPATAWPIDCAELGGTCGNGRCSVAWTAPEAGEVALTEFMAEPPAGTPEWFELTNISDRPVDLQDCTLRSREGAIGEKLSLRTPGPLVLAPGEALVVAQGPAVGNAPRVYEEGYEMPLYGGPEDSDLLRLFCDDTLIDEVIWDGASFGLAVNNAHQLDAGADASGNDAAANWCRAADPAGSPGAPNPPCP